LCLHRKGGDNSAAIFVKLIQVRVPDTAAAFDGIRRRREPLRKGMACRRNGGGGRPGARDGGWLAGREANIVHWSHDGGATAGNGAGGAPESTAGMIAGAIVFLTANFPLTFLAIGLVASLVAIARAPAPRSTALVVDRLIAWHVFVGLGAANLLNFVFHVFFGRMAAAFIGWADSPFQLEVGMASLGFSAVAFVAAFRSFDLRLAAILGPALFSLGAAAGHAYQMVVAHNFAPGNAGVIFYTDILIPLFGFALLWLQHRHPTAVDRRP
jgi:hypothetical protein